MFPRLVLWQTIPVSNRSSINYGESQLNLCMLLLIVTVSAPFPSPKPYTFSDKMQAVSPPATEGLASMFYPGLSLVTPDYHQRKTLISTPPDRAANSRQISLTKTKDVLAITTNGTISLRGQPSLAPRPGKHKSFSVTYPYKILYRIL